MLEPEIKYENCEEIYSGPGPDTEQTNTCAQQQIGGDVINFGSTIVPTANQKRSYTQHLQSVMPEIQALADSIDTGNYLNTASQLGGLNYYVDVQRSALPRSKPIANPMKVKRRRYETNLLFQHPFFNLHEDWDTARTGETITAKCLSCKVTLRGHKNVSSNFIKHMKRLHPELYKVYENYKLLKFQGWNPLDVAGGGAPPGQNLFDHNAFLEQLTNAAAEDLNSTETSTTPPADAPEVTDCNAFSQATSVGNQNPAAAGGPSHSGVGSVRLIPQEKIFYKKQNRSEVDLSSRTLQQMSQLLDVKLSGFVTVGQLEEERRSMLELIENKLEETMTNSNEDDSSILTNKTYSPSTTTNATVTTNAVPTIIIDSNEDSSLQSQLDELKRECEQLRAAVLSARRSKLELRNELDTVDRTIRQRKIFVCNMTMLPGEQPKQAAERLMRDHLKLPEVQVSNAFLLPGQANKTKMNMVLEVQKTQDADSILKNCTNLKNTGIGLEQALGPHALKRKHKMLVLRKEILRRKPNLRVVVRNTHLIVGEKRFYWDWEDGLCVEGQIDDLLAKESSAMQKLKEVTGLDMREFLNVLKNYDVK